MYLLSKYLEPHSCHMLPPFSVPFPLKVVPQTKRAAGVLFIKFAFQREGKKDQSFTAVSFTCQELHPMIFSFISLDHPF